MSLVRMQGIATGLLVGVLSVIGCSSDGGDSNSSDASSVSGGSSTGNGGSAASGSNDTGTTGAAKREMLSCAELETKIEADSVAVGFPTEVTLGEWEGVPAELKVLPDGAEICGSVDILNQGLIKSELGGAALEAYYRPIFDALGCPSLECDVETRGDQEQYACSCFGDAHFGSLTTAPDVAYYLLAYE